MPINLMQEVKSIVKQEQGPSSLPSPLCTSTVLQVWITHG